MTYLNKKQRQRIVHRHNQSIALHGHRVSALFWSSEKVQRIRFKILSRLIEQCGNPANASLLDVGCGFSDLKHYFDEQGLDLDYHGIDLSPDMVQAVRHQNPNINIKTGDIFDANPSIDSYDYVFLSGALNEVVDDEPAAIGDYAKKVIKRMFETARYATAFNLLDSRDSQTAKYKDLQSFHPEEIIDYCSEFCDDIKLIDDYLGNDFTLYLFK